MRPVEIVDVFFRFLSFLEFFPHENVAGAMGGM